MHSLKDSNTEVYKIFAEGNFIIRCAVIEHGHPIHSVIKQVYWSPLKVEGDKNKVHVLNKRTQEQDVFLCPVVQLYFKNTGTNSRFMMEEFDEIMTILEKFYDA